MAQDKPENWKLCPLTDAVPVFPEMAPAQAQSQAQDQALDGNAGTGLVPVAPATSVGGETPPAASLNSPASPGMPTLPTVKSRGQAPDEQRTHIYGDALSGTDAQPVISGNVALTHGDQFLGTDNITYDRDTGKYTATGNVRYQDSSMRVVADSAEGDTNLDSHNLKNIHYQLLERRGNGGAEHVEMQGSQGALYESTYSTCPPDQRVWELRARRIDIDTDAGVGVARNATIRLGRVPVLYAPYLSFPIDDRRRTGLLYPSIGLSGRNGFDWRQPIYFNLALNYDLTLTPRLMTKRGFMLGTEFRYLTDTGHGVLDVQYLPNDKLADRERDDEIAEGVPADNRRAENRGRFAFSGSQNLADAWQARANLSWISDPRYVEDFRSSLDTISSYYLTSNLGIYGLGRYWDAGVMATHYQLADYTLRESLMPYDRLPRLYFDLDQPVANRRFRVGINAEAVRFQHIDSDAKPGGSRLDLKPFISMPMQGPSWFITPTIAWRYTAYSLEGALADQVAQNRACTALGLACTNASNSPTAAQTAAYRNTSPSRSMPIASFDAGLYFDRNTSIGGTSFLQTLEPRLFYLYAPYRDQSNLPLFDTANMTFSWGQLFRDNRFTGADRQEDANQLTLALTTRFIRQSDGMEKLTASIGQIQYFDDSRVGLTGNSPPVEQGKSAWVLDTSYAVNDRWTFNGSYQWDPTYHGADLLSLRTRYLVGDDGVVNLSYRYRRNLAYDPTRPESASNNPDLLKQVDLSFLYPVTPSWSLIGRYYYSLRDRQLLEGIAGVQWDSCCLAVRVVGRRYVRNRTGEMNSAIQVEFELKGLGSAGPDTEGRLRRAILGYDRDDLYLIPPAPSIAASDDDGSDDDSTPDLSP